MRLPSRWLVVTLSCLGVLHIFTDTFESGESRRLQNREISTTSAIVPSGTGYGHHYVTLYVGNPAKIMRLKVVIGSNYTAFPCTGCSNCGTSHSGEPFDYSNSLLSQCTEPCFFPKAKCGESSTCRVDVTVDDFDDISGEYASIEVQDSAYIDVTDGTTESLPPNVAERKGFPLFFLCQTEVSGDLYDEKADGVLGLSTSPTSFLSQMHSEGKIPAPIFSMCFRGFDEYQPDGTSAGRLILGGYERDHHITPLVWAFNTASQVPSSGYTVNLRRVYLGLAGNGDDALIRLAQGIMTAVPTDFFDKGFTPPSKATAILETGKPTSFLHSAYEAGFRTVFKTAANLDFNINGMEAPGGDLSIFPTLFLQLEAHDSQGDDVPSTLPGFAGSLDSQHPYDILLAVPPRHYLALDGNLAKPSLGFSDQTTIIGTDLLQAHDVIFDSVKKRIGFAQQSDCPESLALLPPSKTSSLGRSFPGDTAAQNTADEGTEESNTEKDQTQGRSSATPEPVVEVQEQFAGLPEAEGGHSGQAFRFGPGVVTSDEALGGVKSSHFGFDMWQLGGIIAALGSFGLTIWITRGTEDDKMVKDFVDTNSDPVFYDELAEDDAWNNPWQYQDTASSKKGDKQKSNGPFSGGSQGSRTATTKGNEDDTGSGAVDDDDESMQSTIATRASIFQMATDAIEQLSNRNMFASRRRSSTAKESAIEPSYPAALASRRRSSATGESGAMLSKPSAQQNYFTQIDQSYASGSDSESSLSQDDASYFVKKADPKKADPRGGKSKGESSSYPPRQSANPDEGTSVGYGDYRSSRGTPTLRGRSTDPSIQHSNGSTSRFLKKGENPFVVNPLDQSILTMEDFQDEASYYMGDSRTSFRRTDSQRTGNQQMPVKAPKRLSSGDDDSMLYSRDGGGYSARGGDGSGSRWDDDDDDFSTPQPSKNDTFSKQSSGKQEYSPRRYSRNDGYSKQYSRHDEYSAHRSRDDDLISLDESHDLGSLV